jgi:hypothetical protein
MTHDSHDSPRPIVQAFCVGQAKAGTASLFGLFAKRYRAAHEPERAQLLDVVQRHWHGELDERALGEYLIERDRRLNLEYDIAWGNQFLVGLLATVFPDAKFIVLVRDPYTWLGSFIGHLASRDVPTDVRSFLNSWLRPERYPPTRADRQLVARGAYSIAALLNAWNTHVDECVQGLPPARRLVLRTHELNQSAAVLAQFLHIPLESLDRQRGHLNRGAWSERLDSLVDRAHVDAVIRELCRDHLARLFPEVSGRDDVDALWNARPSA